MSGFEDFMARLDPKTAARYQVAQELELVKHETASLGLTTALGGGIGAGRLSMVYGPFSTGKSVLMMQSVGRWQKEGKVCAWVDVEGTYEKDFAEKLGVNNDELILIQKKSSGSVEEEIKPLLRAGVDNLVVDSISDIVPMAFVDKDDDILEQDKRKQIGQHAKAITALCWAILYENDKTAVTLISQVTTKIEPNYVKLVPHGGNKTLHACSQIIKLTSSNTEAQQIKGEFQMGDAIVTEPIGRKVEYYVEKNKLGRQSRKGEYDLYYAGDSLGIDYYGEIADLAEKFGLVRKSGSWMKVRDTEKQYQGRPALVKAMKADDLLFEMLEAGVRKILEGAA